MTSATVNNAAFVRTAEVTAQNTATTRTGSTETDFSKIMSQARDKVQQAEIKKEEPTSERKTTSQNEESRHEVQTKDDTCTAKETTTEDTKQKKESFVEATSQEPTEDVDETVREAVENAAVNMLEGLQELLEVSDEELIQTMEELGLQPLDLLNTDNLAQLLMTLAGEDSQINLVTDENLYVTLQELTQMAGGKIQELLETTGLQEEELATVLEQVKQLEEQLALQENTNVVATEETGDMFETLQAEKPEGLPMQNLPAQNEKTVPVVITAKDEELPITKEPMQNEVVEMAETISESSATDERKEHAEGEESGFQKQQDHVLSFQENLEATQEATATEATETFDSKLPSTENILKQIADFVKIQSGKELTEMELQLHPASLGTVHVQLSTKGGVVTAQFTAETETVKNAIEAQTVQLKANLEEQGIKVEAVEVSVASHQMERNLDQNGKGQRESESDGSTGKIQKLRRMNINLNMLEEEDTLEEQLAGADDATRIAMEMMASSGNTMDLLA